MPQRFPRLREPQYWLVGAFWEDDQTPVFVRRGYWQLGWRDRDKPDMARKRDGMHEGDRIAIKAMTGQAKQNITIKAIGIVKEVSKDKDKRVYVDWKLTDLHRKVRANGCFASIHGPYSVEEDGEWLGETFRL